MNNLCEHCHTQTVYHVFSNESDEWLTDYSEAKALFTEWGEQFGCARLYREVWPANAGELGLDTPISEECLEATGEYPF